MNSHRPLRLVPAEPQADRPQAAVDAEDADVVVQRAVEAGEDFFAGVDDRSERLAMMAGFYLDGDGKPRTRHNSLHVAPEAPDETR